MTISEAVAARIDELMAAKGITQYRLSMQSGVPQSTLCEIRRSKNRSIGIRTLLDISEGMGVTLSEFFDSPLFSSVTD